MHTKIELQPRREQHLARWEDLGADLELAKLPYKIETDRLGRILIATIFRSRPLCRGAIQRREEAWRTQDTDGQIAILKVTDDSAFDLRLTDFLRIDFRDNCERPMTVEDFANDVAIENFTAFMESN